MSSSRRSRRRDPEWVRTFEITSLIREAGSASSTSSSGVGGVGVAFRITSVVYAGGFPEASTRLTVTKSFGQVRRLHQDLHSTHRALHLRGEFPTLPAPPAKKKRWLGTSSSSSAPAPSSSDPEAVEERRRAIMLFLEFSARHPPLFNSQAFVDFFSLAAAEEAKEEDDEDEQSSPDTTRTTSPAEVAIRVAELKSEGNVMDAAAETTRRSVDPTPALLPQRVTVPPSSWSSAASSALATPVPTPSRTSPDEEMTDLPDYLSAAAEDVSAAVRHEIEDDLDESVACYRRAIGTLLTSVQRDRCLRRQASVKRRIAQYIEKAEGLVQERDRRRAGGVLTPIVSSQAASPTKKASSRVPHLDFVGDAAELKKYKVLGVISEKLLVASDFASGSKVVIKTLQKSAGVSAKARKKRSLLPIGVPNMVRLLKYYETDDALFLVLEHLKFGQIYEVVGNLFLEREEREEDAGASASNAISSDSSASGQTPSSPSGALVNPVRSVIKTSPSFVEFRSGREEEGESGSTTDSAGGDMDVVVHQQGDGGNSRLLCFSRDGIENIACDENEDDDEDDEEEDEVYDFMNDCVDEEGEEAKPDKDLDRVVGASESLLSSINSKLLEDNNEKASSLLEHLDNLESRIQFHLAGGEDGARPMSPVPSPFRRPSSTMRPRTPNTPTSSSTLLPTTTAAKQEEDPTEAAKSLPAFHGYRFSPGEPLPHGLLRRWAIQLCSALFALHSRGLLVGDLHPGNLLLSDDGDLVLSYKCEWATVEGDGDEATATAAAALGYAAPETRDPTSVPGPARDWWSAGVLLLELASGLYFADLHPSGLLRSHTPAEVPETVEARLASLVSALLHPSPELRLAEDGVRAHPYFEGVDWN